MREEGEEEEGIKRNRLCDVEMLWALTDTQNWSHCLKSIVGFYASDLKVTGSKRLASNIWLLSPGDNDTAAHFSNMFSFFANEDW